MSCYCLNDINYGTTGLLAIYYYCSGIKILVISTQEGVLLTTYTLNKTLLTTDGCAVVRLRALVARQSARLISNRPIAEREVFPD
jgi:hypothetical protein